MGRLEWGWLSGASSEPLALLGGLGPGSVPGFVGNGWLGEEAVEVATGEDEPDGEEAVEGEEAEGEEAEGEDGASRCASLLLAS